MVAVSVTTPSRSKITADTADAAVQPGPWRATNDTGERAAGAGSAFGSGEQQASGGWWWWGPWERLRIMRSRMLFRPLAAGGRRLGDMGTSLACGPRSTGVL